MSNPPMRIVDAAAATRALPFPELIDALRRAFRDGCDVPAREHHAIAQGNGPAATLLLMPAWNSRGYLGIKTVTVFPENRARTLPALHSSYLLCDGTTGQHLALIDGNVITARRTVAASALAADFLARPDASSLLLVGAGRIARLTAHAYRAVRPIRRVTLWARRQGAAEDLALDLNREGFDAVATTDLAAATGACDIVSCATLSTAPLLRGAWLRPGTHVYLIGAFAPHMRETDAEVIGRASVFIDTPEALHEAGDLLQARDEGRFDPAAVHGTLQDLCRGCIGGRSRTEEITLFKSVGTALEDLAAATLVGQSLDIAIAHSNRRTDP